VTDTSGRSYSEAVPVSPLERGERLLPRQRFFNQMPDKGLFAAVAVGGFVAIILLKIYGINANFVAAGAVIVMLVYGFVAFRFRRVQLRPDRLGDNFYYLGFIYTLASLSAALLQLERDNSPIEGILGSFGIALFTTIFGVAGRVLFVQLRNDIDEVEDEVRRDLQSTAADLRGQLNTTLADFETFQLGVHQAAEEAAKGASKVVQDAISNISRVANAAAEGFDQALSREAERVHDLRDSITRMDGRLNSLVENINDRMDEFNDRMERMTNILADAVELIGRVKPKRRFWIFSRR
jgi:methyl-accepting chemotaxis protein